MSSLGQIYEGWKNKLLPDSDLKEEIQKVSSERLKICEQCPNHSKNIKSLRPDEHCIACGCTLSAKTACLSCSCPINKWLAVIHDPIVEDELKKLNDGRTNR